MTLVAMETATGDRAHLTQFLHSYPWDKQWIIASRVSL